MTKHIDWTKEHYILLDRDGDAVKSKGGLGYTASLEEVYEKAVLKANGDNDEEGCRTSGSYQPYTVCKLVPLLELGQPRPIPSRIEALEGLSTIDKSKLSFLPAEIFSTLA